MTAERMIFVSEMDEEESESSGLREREPDEEIIYIFNIFFNFTNLKDQMLGNTETIQSRVKLKQTVKQNRKL